MQIESKVNWHFQLPMTTSFCQAGRKIGNIPQPLNPGFLPPSFNPSMCPLGAPWLVPGAPTVPSAMSAWPNFFLRWLGKGHKKGKTRRKTEKHVARVQEDTFGRATVRSLGGFALGMTLSAAYGALVIFGQGYSIWYCLVSTITLALVLGLGMAFSFKVRVTVLLMLPQFFSSKCPLPP